MRLVDDRLAQYARILRAQAQPQSGDNMFELGARQSAVLELAQPITRGFLTDAVTAGTLTDPLQESFALFDGVSRTGALGFNSRAIAIISPGLWHLSIEKVFHFTGTTNQAAASTLQLGIGVNAVLGTQAFSSNLFRDTHYNGVHFHENREVWLPMVDMWQLNHVVFATIAGDLLDDHIHIVARRFF